MAPSKPIHSDPGDKATKEPPKDTDLTKIIQLQKGEFDFPWAVYIHAKLGHETPGNVKQLRNDQLTQEIRKAAR